MSEQSIQLADTDSPNLTSVEGFRAHEVYSHPHARLLLDDPSLRLQQPGRSIRLVSSERDRMGGLLGRSAAMRGVFALLECVAPTDETVLIEGETGSGKELAAEAIHLASQRANGPFVIFDCSAVSAPLVESELFGHLRGSFTGAMSDRMGAFEAADGGTLFFDEIGELPLDLQPKLLRALERRQVRRLGSNVARPVDVRFVAATNRTLAHEVERGRFRQDLFYRLAVVPVSLPPLRERIDDIPMLVRHFERQICDQSASVKLKPISDALMNEFAAQLWPGNVRELRNAVARLHVLGVAHVQRHRTTLPPPPPPLGVDLAEPLLTGRKRVADVYEKAYLQVALQQTEGNVSQTAEIANVNRKFVQRAIKRHGLTLSKVSDELE